MADSKYQNGVLVQDRVYWLVCIQCPCACDQFLPIDRHAFTIWIEATVIANLESSSMWGVLATSLQPGATHLQKATRESPDECLYVN